MTFFPPKIDQRGYEDVVQQLSGLAEKYTAEWAAVDETLVNKVLAESIIDAEEKVLFTANTKIVLENAQAGEVLLADLENQGIEEVWVKSWSPRKADAGTALIRIFGNMVTTVGDRLNQVPEKNFLSFLDLIGAQLKPPQAARVALTFSLAEGTQKDAFVPEGTSVAAPPSEDQSEEIIFETDRPLVVTPAQLQTVWIQDPQNGLYGDRLSEATGQIDAAYDAFAGVEEIPHYLYLTCPNIFGMTGLETIELAIASPTNAQAKKLKALSPTWQMWNGQIWTDKTPATNNIQTQHWNLAFNDLTRFSATEYQGQIAPWLRAKLDTNPQDSPVIQAIESTVEIRRNNLVPVKALRNDVGLDLTKEFYPFGEESETGDTFYLQLHPESIQPNGEVQISLRLEEEINITDSDVTVKWEIGNGLIWQDVTWKDSQSIQFYEKVTGEQTIDATLQLPTVLPQQSTVDGELGYWLRARITKGFFGTLPKARRYPIYDELTILASQTATTRNTITVESADILETGDVIRLYPIVTTTDYQYPEERTITKIAGKTIALDANPNQVLAVGTRVLRKTIATDFVTPIYTAPQVKLILLSYDFQLTENAILKAENDFGFAQGDTFETNLFRSAKLGDRLLNLNTVAGLDVGEYLTVEDLEYQIAGIIPDLKRVVLATAVTKYAPKYTPVTRAFRPFVPILEAEPTIYFGFDRCFSNNTTTLFFQIEPPDPDTEPDFSGQNPQLIWEYSSPTGWQRLGVQDETQGFSQRGIVQFIAPTDLTMWRLKDREQAWLRVRWAAGQFPITPYLRRVLTNTTWAEQATTLREELLGSSTGDVAQSFYTRQTPVLTGEILGVDEGILPEPETLIELGQDPVGVIRDDLGEVEQVWVRWREVMDFYSSKAGDRHYTLDRQTGEIRFGDGQSGMIPPTGRQNIRLSSYQTGGGDRGNIAAKTITQLKTTIPYVAGVINLEAAGGGAEQEELNSLKERAPKQLRHRDRAVTLEDVADLAYEASTEVARVKVLTPDLLTPNFNAINEQFWLDPTEEFESFEDLLDSQGKKVNSNAERDLLTQAMRDLHSLSGSVRLIILPQSAAQRPTASLALLEQIRRYIEARSEASIEIMMIPPRWQEVKVTASLVPVSLDEADRISQAVLEKLDEFLHPLTGGEGNGWQFGRYPHDSDVYALLQSLPEVNYVEDLTIELAQTEDSPQITAEDFDETTLIYSGRHNITLVSPAGGAT